jgi:uncharacterized membrane protein YkvA (DUF1232 family)
MAQQDRRGQLQKLMDRMSLAWRLIVDRRVDLGYKLIPLVGLLYVISPIDFMPEAFLGPFGVFDDIGVILLALDFFIRMAPDDVVKEHLRHLRGRMAGTQTPSQDGVIEGEYVVQEKPKR